MTNFTTSSARANIAPAHFNTWYVQNATAADPAFHSLGPIRNGRASLKSVSTKDGDQRAHVQESMLEATARMMATGKAHVLKVLDTLSSAKLDHILKGNAYLLESNNLTPSGFGFKWKFVCDRTQNESRYIDVTARRSIGKGEIVDLYPEQQTALGTPAADTLLPLDSIDESDIIPAGFTQIDIGVANANYQTITAFRNTKLTMELQTSPDDLLMDVGQGVMVNVEAEMMQTRTATNGGEIGQLGNLSNQKSDVKITLRDGTVVTLVNSLGLDWEYSNVGDAGNDIQVIKLIGGGWVPVSALDVIFV